MNNTTISSGMDPWLLARLVCPRDHGRLGCDAGWLTCAGGHRYPVVDGIPVLLVSESLPTHWAGAQSLDEAVRWLDDPRPLPHARSDDRVDEWVQEAIGATNGNLYGHLINKLPRYPIPVLPVPAGAGRVLLDVGCNWGRWTIAAARAGYQAIGLDPSLPGVLAARRVCHQLGVTARFVVADARFLPLDAGTVDVAFSYSVLQHFSPEDVAASATEIGRVLAPGGFARVQMASVAGLRNLFQVVRRAHRAREFQVRYWWPGRLQQLFAAAIGPTRVDVDGFFTLNAQIADLDLLTPRLALVVRVSGLLRRISAYVRPLVYLADSIYLTSESRRSHP